MEAEAVPKLKTNRRMQSIIFGDCRRALSPSNPHIRGVAEMILVMGRERKRLIGQGSDISIEEYDSWTKNVWEIDTEADRRHPAPFPVEIPKRLIKLYSYRGNHVLDPFVGRGTTLKAAEQLGRAGVGIELSRTYLPLIRESVRKLQVLDDGMWNR